MKGLVSLFGFEEKVGNTRLYYNGPTLDASTFRYLVLWCVIGSIKSLIVGPGLFDLVALTFVILVWGIVDWYFAKRALKVMKRVVMGDGIKVDSIDLDDVKILEDENEIEWVYRDYKGLIEIRYENRKQEQESGAEDQDICGNYEE